jgi:hypothetical protein
MKRPKSNKSAKALKVLILTKLDRPQHIATDNRENREHAKRLKYDFSTAYLIRADQLPAIVEAMAKGLHKVQWRHSWRSVSPVAKEALRRYTRAQFKTIGIDAKEGV